MISHNLWISSIDNRKPYKVNHAKPSPACLSRKFNNPKSILFPISSNYASKTNESQVILLGLIPNTKTSQSLIHKQDTLYASTINYLITLINTLTLANHRIWYTS